MFVIVDNPRAWWPVTFRHVSEEGEISQAELAMQFSVFGEDEYLEHERRASAAMDAISSGEYEGSPTEAAADFVLTFAHDWRGVAASNGEPLPFNRENLVRLLRRPNVLAAIGIAFSHCRAGKAELREPA